MELRFNPASIRRSKRSRIARSFSSRSALRHRMKTSSPAGAGHKRTSSPSCTCFHSWFNSSRSEKNPQAQRGYSRDRRPDCKQVNLALVVSRQGLPLGYEIFAGNRHDATTVEEMGNAIENKYGKAGRIWGMDRGMTSEDNVEFLKQGRTTLHSGDSGLPKACDRIRSGITRLGIAGDVSPGHLCGAGCDPVCHTNDHD